MTSRTWRAPPVALTTLAVGAFFTAQEVFMDVAGRRAELASRDIINGLQFWIVWAMLTPLIVAAIRRWPLHTPPVARPIAIHAVVAVSLAALHNVLSYAVTAVGNGFRVSPNG